MQRAGISIFVGRASGPSEDLPIFQVGVGGPEETSLLMLAHTQLAHSPQNLGR
jgi:hypothetical protein